MGHQRRNFYPRPRVEGDQGRKSPILFVLDFYPRPRVEGDVGVGIANGTQLDFYPRPRVEGDEMLPDVVGAAAISTHALA